MKKYQKSFLVRWADLDPNRHLRHTAYNDYATQVRLSCLNENGFGAKKFSDLNFGPVMFREETRYFKEVGMNEEITIDFKVVELSAKGERWKMAHDIYKKDGSLAATITLEGAWFDITSRKLIAPPQELVDLLNSLP